MIFPKWLNELFYAFALEYKNSWTNDMVSPQMQEDKKNIWLNALVRYRPETITKAGMEILRTEDYPRLSKMCKMCDEISKTSRYENVTAIAPTREKRQPRQSPTKEWWLDQQGIDKEVYAAPVKMHSDEEVEKMFDDLYKKLGCNRKTQDVKT